MKRSATITTGSICLAILIIGYFILLLTRTTASQPVSMLSQSDQAKPGLLNSTDAKAILGGKSNADLPIIPPTNGQDNPFAALE